VVVMEFSMEIWDLMGVNGYFSWDLMGISGS
jgi:hypothetical protein